ncbi:MFS transporter [Actinospongicola halichondriae]|uniref:MFS transporter n=1 Tax=Actinospongicola halichondriae TaxID=3236844 RepID=UPI003D538873
MTIPGTPGTPGTPVTERRIQVSAVSTALVGVLPVFLTGALAVQIGRDIELGPSRLGIASGSFFAAAALGSALMGRLAERIGPGTSMRMSGIVAAVLLAFVAAVESYPVLLVLLFAAGLSNALAQVAANLLVAKGVAPERQGWSLAMKQAGVPAGTLLGGLAVPLLGVTVGWRWAFVAAACGAIAAAVSVPVHAVPGGGRAEHRRPEGDVPLRPLLLLAFAVGFASAANGSLATFMVSAGVDAGLGESAAGFVLMGGSAVGIAMRLLAGQRADKRGGRHLPVVSALLVGGAIGYLFLAPGEVLTHLLGAAVAFGSGWAWPGLFNLAVVRLNPSAPGAATGITQTGVYVGALAGPILFGLVVDAWGYELAWSLAAASSVGSAIGMGFGRRQILQWRDGYRPAPAVRSEHS